MSERGAPVQVSESKRRRECQSAAGAKASERERQKKASARAWRVRGCRSAGRQCKCQSARVQAPARVQECKRQCE